MKKLKLRYIPITFLVIKVPPTPPSILPKNMVNSIKIGFNVYILKFYKVFFEYGVHDQKNSLKFWLLV